jgi:hypothetical protein
LLPIFGYAQSEDNPTGFHKVNINDISQNYLFKKLNEKNLEKVCKMTDHEIEQKYKFTLNKEANPIKTLSQYMCYKITIDYND